MYPFDSYPNGGRQRLGLPKGGNCRHGYGRDFMRETGQTHCVYCGIDLTDPYENWLTMVLDHVVPASVCKAYGIPPELIWDFSNTVLACAACNGFCNRFRHSDDAAEVITEENFYDHRDVIFTKRKDLIADRRREERKFFEGRPWERKV